MNSEKNNFIATDLIQVEISVKIGDKKISISELSNLRNGDILTLDQNMSDGVELCVGEKVVARGELISTEDEDPRICVRILGAP